MTFSCLLRVRLRGRQNIWRSQTTDELITEVIKYLLITISLTPCDNNQRTQTSTGSMFAGQIIIWRQL